MQNYPTLTAQQNTVVRSFMGRTYNWMAAGLALTAAIAWLTASNMDMAMMVLQWRMPLLLAQLGIVFALSGLVTRLSATAAGALFIVYAALTGLTFSGLLLAYDLKSVAAAFLTAAGTFGGMSIAGYVTKKDLSGMGRFLMFGVIGLLVAMIVNLFVGGTALTMIISVVGVLLFAGLTAYDTQKLKEMALSGVQGEQAERAAINGALTLYLDFVNIFLFLLRLFGGGDRR